jgi:SAM-dependent methyltransferase
MLNCRICENSKDNKTYKVHEMMFGCRDEFTYIECAECGCLQIDKIPEDILRYYPSDSYYSYSASNVSILEKVKVFLKGKRIKHTLTGEDTLGSVLNRIFGEVVEAPWLKKANLQLSTRILDVGCGAGSLILRLKSAGFEHVEGIDPFILEDTYYKNGVKVLKKFLNEVSETYDFIMLNHSFEHMSDPLTALKELCRILKPGGTILIRIPMASSYAWRTYRENWVQLDAPRHLYLHSEKSMQILAKQSGLSILFSLYDSNEFQFWGSEAYEQGKSLVSQISRRSRCLRFLLHQLKMENYKQKAHELNHKQDGDQACFFLKNLSDVIKS